MFSSIAAFLGGLFNSSKLTDTAIDAMRKMGGLDEMQDKEKAAFLLSYIDKTKHQSEARRFIALVVVGLWAIVLMLWLITSGVGTILELSNVMLYAADLKLLMKEQVKDPFTIILSFYFVINIVQKVGGRS